MEKPISQPVLITIIGIAFMFVPRKAFELFEFFFGAGASTFVTFLQCVFAMGGVVLVAYVLYKIRKSL